MTVRWFQRKAKRPADSAAGLRSLQAELEKEREAARGMRLQLAEEVQMARKATQGVAKARAEREQYRRVLAAAVANEKRAQEHAESVRADLARVQDTMRDADRARGVAEGRSRELELQLAAGREEHERDLAAAQDQAWSEAESRRRETQELSFERGFARGQVRELLRKIPPDSPPSARAAALRARTSVLAGAAAGVLALSFLPALGLALFTQERAEYLRLATGISAGGLLLLTAVLAGACLVLISWGVREMRGSEREAIEAVERDAGDTHGGPEPSNVGSTA